MALIKTNLTYGTTGNLPAVNGSAVTNLTSGNLSGNLPALNGSALTALTSANLTGNLPAISGASLTGLRLVTDNHYTLVNAIDYHETDAYTTTSSTNQFTCTDQSLTFTTTAQTHGNDIILIHGSLSANSDANDNGFGIFMIHSTTSDFSSGTATTLQTGRYGEALMTGEYSNTTGFARLTGLSNSTQYYVRMFAMIQRPSNGTVTINQDGYATSGSVRHGVVVQQYMKN